MIIRPHLHMSKVRTQSRLLNVIIAAILKGSIRLDTQQIYLWYVT